MRSAESRRGLTSFSANCCESSPAIELRINPKNYHTYRYEGTQDIQMS
jgi:hypothetical protein